MAEKRDRPIGRDLASELIAKGQAKLRNPQTSEFKGKVFEEGLAKLKEKLSLSQDMAQIDKQELANKIKIIELLGKQVGSMERNLALKQKFMQIAKKTWKIMQDISTIVIGSLVGGLKTVWGLIVRWRNYQDEIALQLRQASDSLKNQVGYSKSLDKSMRGIAMQAFRLGFNISDAAEIMGSLVEEMGSPDVGKFAGTMLTMTKGFGLGSKEAAKLFENLTLGAGKSEEEIRILLGGVREWARETHMSYVLVTKDIGENIDFFARFGEQAIDTFKSSTHWASNFGLRMKELIKISEKFDTFSGAAEQVMKLNAMFGTTLNTVEMLVETDPAKRLKKVRDALLEQGKSWDNLDYFQRKNLATMIGLDEASLEAVLNKKNEKISIEDAMKAREKAAKSEKELDRSFKSSLKEMANVFVRYFGREGMFTKLLDTIGRALEPLSRMIFGGEKSLVGAFQAFFNELAGGQTERAKKFKKFLEEVGTWIQGLYTKAEKFLFGAGGFFSEGNFDNVINMGKSAFETIKSLGDTLVAVFEKLRPALVFAANNFDSILKAALAIKAVSMGPLGVGAAVVGMAAVAENKNLEDFKSNLASKAIRKRLEAGRKSGLSGSALEEFVAKGKEKFASSGFGGMAKDERSEIYEMITKREFDRINKLDASGKAVKERKAKEASIVSELAKEAVKTAEMLSGKRKAAPGMGALDASSKDLAKLAGKGLGTSPKDIKNKFGAPEMKSELSIIKTNIKEFQGVMNEISKLVKFMKTMPDMQLANKKLVDIAALAPALHATAVAFKGSKAKSVSVSDKAAEVSKGIFIVASDIYLDSEKVGAAYFHVGVNS